MSILTRLSSIFSRSEPKPRMQPEPTGRPIRGSYDAARDGNETVNIWANSDALDADAANSLAVRTKLRNRDRYERSNNGHKCGIHRTQANYVIGTGPKLKMQTASKGFNAMVEAKWNQWVKATQFFRKLRTENRAKTGDGEGLGLIISDESVTDPVKLNFRPIECDQLAAPVMRANDKNYVDGIHFDEAGNPIAYDILRRHPGSTWFGSVEKEYDTYAAKFVCHWFLHERSGQHRGIPESTSTLNLYPTARRFREATVASAETAADFTAAVEMGSPAEGPDEVAPFTTLPVEKRTMVVMPAGSKMSQMRAEHPATTYEMFNRETLCEEARPLNMPYNIAACDSSGYSYSGGQLDHQTFFVSVDVERQECEMDVADRVFAVWFEEAAWTYGWNVNATPAPKHEWGWPGRPHTDQVKTAVARKTRLATGQTTLSAIYAEDGLDFDDELPKMAAEYGVSVDEMRGILRRAVFGKAADAAPAGPPPDGDAGSQAAPLPGANRFSSSPNGNGRARVPV